MGFTVREGFCVFCFGSCSSDLIKVENLEKRTEKSIPTANKFEVFVGL